VGHPSSEKAKWAHAARRGRRKTRARGQPWRASEPTELARQDTAAMGWPTMYGPVRRPLRSGETRRCSCPAAPRGRRRNGHGQHAPGKRVLSPVRANGPGLQLPPARTATEYRPAAARVSTVNLHLHLTAAGRGGGRCRGGGRSAARPCWLAPRRQTRSRGRLAELRDAAPRSRIEGPKRRAGCWPAQSTAAARRGQRPGMERRRGRTAAP